MLVTALLAPTIAAFVLKRAGGLRPEDEPSDAVRVAALAS